MILNAACLRALRTVREFWEEPKKATFISMIIPSGELDQRLSLREIYFHQFLVSAFIEGEVVAEGVVGEEDAIQMV